MKKDRTLPFIEYFNVVIKWRSFIYREVGSITLATLIISLLIPNHFTSTVTVLPPSPEREAMFGLMFSNIPTGLTGITGASGLLGGPTASDLYANIMKSQRIMDEVIKKNDLQSVFNTKTMYDTYVELLDMTKIVVTPEEIISVSVTYTDKYLAADIANSFVEELDKFNTEAAMTIGKKYRIFVEQRLIETEDSLTKVENALRKFQEEHKTVALDTEIQSAIEIYVELKGQILRLEVKKGASASSSQIDNPYLNSINKELRELRKQLNKMEMGDSIDTKNEFGVGFSVPFNQLPEISQQYVRLVRDVKVQEAIYEVMTQQYEQAKIIELKDTPTVQVLDSAIPAEKKSYPRRLRVTMAMALLSFLAGVCLAFLFEHIEKVKKEPSESSKWSKIFSELKKDFDNLKKKIPFVRKL